MASTAGTPGMTGLEDVAKTLSDTFKALTDQMTQLGNSLQRIVTMGLAATNEGNRLSYSWMMFSRQIASIFLPTINFVIVKLQQMTEWFKKLTGDQQQLISMLGSVALGFVMLTPIISILMAVLSPLTLLIAGLGGILYVFFTKSALGKAIMESVKNAALSMTDVLDYLGHIMDVISDTIAVAIDSVLAVFVAFGLAISNFVADIISYIPFLGDAADKLKEWNAAGQAQLDLLVKSANREIGKRDKGPESPNTQVNPSGFGFESLSASFERITSAANKQDLAKESLKVQKDQLVQLVGIVGALKQGQNFDNQSGGADY